MKGVFKNNKNELPEPDSDLNDFYGFENRKLDVILLIIVIVILSLVAISQANIFSQGSTRHSASMMRANGRFTTVTTYQPYNVTDNGGEAYRVTDNGGEDYNVH